MYTDRRTFLRLTGSAAPALAIACQSNPKTSSSNTPDAGSGTRPDEEEEEGYPSDTGQTDDDTGLLIQDEDSGEPIEPDDDVDDDGVVLADPGHGLERRVPSAVTSSSNTDDEVTLAVLSGELPTDLHGHMLVVHPIPPDDEGGLFTGNGRVIRIDLGGDEVKAKLSIVRTPCWYADVASRGQDYEFTASSLARASFTLGGRNLANTAFAIMGNRLLSTYDGGRPTEIDPETLTYATAVGSGEEWQGTIPSWTSLLMPMPFPMVMSTAHPAIDPYNHDLYTVEYGLEILGTPSFLHLKLWHGTGSMKTWIVVDQDGVGAEIEQSVHQLVVTRNYVVIVDTSILVEVESLFDPTVMRPQSPDTSIWVIRRSDLDSTQDTVMAKKVVVQRELTHLFPDYDDSGGQIVLHVGHTQGQDASEFLQPDDVRADTGQPVRSDLYGFLPSGTDLGALGRIVIDGESGELLEHDVLYDERLWGGPALYTHLGPDQPERVETAFWLSLGLHPELRVKRIQDAYLDHPYREVAIEDIPAEGVNPSIVRVRTETLTIEDSYTFPDGRLASSPQFVPREGSTGQSDGYLLCTMLSDDTDTVGSSGCEVWIFDATNLAQGPLTRLGNLGLNVPFTLHAAWMPEMSPRTSSYKIDVRSDIEDLVDRHSTEIRTMFEYQVYPHFDD